MASTESAGPYTAVVTGASGFVASEVVKQLLIKGWNVRGTVRSLSKKEKVQHLQALSEVSRWLFVHQAASSQVCGSCNLPVSLQALPGKLTLHEADLLKKGSFDDVMKVSCVVQTQVGVGSSTLLVSRACFLQGVDYVFHTASPFLASWEDTQKELIEPALNGTATVLDSVAKSKGTIKRVILTSSFAGMSVDTSSGPICNTLCASL